MNIQMLKMLLAATEPQRKRNMKRVSPMMADGVDMLKMKLQGLLQSESEEEDEEDKPSGLLSPESVQDEKKKKQKK